MNKGFTLIELVLTIVVVSILSAFTFSVLWQYSTLYADTKGGYIYSEASAVLERMSRELRDAVSVDSTAFPGGNHAISSYISLQIDHPTPADTPYAPAGGVPYWLQYCTCTAANGSQRLYRIVSAASLGTNACSGSCPTEGNGTARMSASVNDSTGFQVQYNQGTFTPNGDSYEVKLQLKSGQTTGSQSITLVTRVFPRNLLTATWSYGGSYYDEIK